MAKDPYEVLGVARNATQDQIRKSYRDLVKKYHPDRYRGHPLEELAEEKMAEINAAYETLQRQGSSRQQQGPYGQGSQRGGQQQGPYGQGSYRGGQQQGPYGQNPWGYRPGQQQYRQQQQYGSPYYQNRGSASCCDGLTALCCADCCCEAMGGDLCLCC